MRVKCVTESLHIYNVETVIAEQWHCHTQNSIMWPNSIPQASALCSGQGLEYHFQRSYGISFEFVCKIFCQ